jgi:hypothetical protein
MKGGAEDGIGAMIMEGRERSDRRKGSRGSFSKLKKARKQILP